MMFVDRQFLSNPLEPYGKVCWRSAFSEARNGRRASLARLDIGYDADADAGCGSGHARLSIDNRRPSNGDRMVFGG